MILLCYWMNNMTKLYFRCVFFLFCKIICCAFESRTHWICIFVVYIFLFWKTIVIWVLKHHRIVFSLCIKKWLFFYRSLPFGIEMKRNERESWRGRRNWEGRGELKGIGSKEGKDGVLKGWERRKMEFWKEAREKCERGKELDVGGEKNGGRGGWSNWVRGALLSIFTNFQKLVVRYKKV